LQERDTEALKRLAHTLKGAAMNVGAILLENDALALEATQEDRQKESGLIDQLERDLKGFQNLLQEEGFLEE
jgi:HPt (histidine-containing phosphotransfer) domain-containing protein